MNEYQRFISYIYSYPGGVKDKNVGFAKVWMRNGQFKLNISLRGIRTDAPELFSVYIIITDNSGYVLVKIGNCIIKDGIAEYADIFNAENINRTELKFSDIKGLCVAREDDAYYMMFSLWEDGEINQNKVTFADKNYKKTDSPKTENESENKEAEALHATECESEKEPSPVMEQEPECESEKEPSPVMKQEPERESVEADKRVEGIFENLFENAEYIDAFDDDYLYDCIEVTPSVFSELISEDKSMAENSFLLHGYYNFHHVLFGRVRENDNNTHYFIGVPGMYCNREHFMANTFGFNNFKRSHRSDCGNPYFGYWYQEI